MKILLIRHAESANNTKFDMKNLEEYRLKRVEDPVITEKGKAQSQNLGLYLLKKKLKLKKLYCSAMVRSMETATIINSFINTKVEIKVNIHEVGGIYNSTSTGTGKSKSWIKQNFPKLHICPEVTENGWFSLEEKETKAQGLERARDVIEDFKKWAAEGAVNDDEYIGLVSHGNFMDALLAVLLDRKEDSKLKLVHANTGLTCFEFDKEGTYRLIYVNMADHLEEDFSVLALEYSKQGHGIVDSKIEEVNEEEAPGRLSRSVSNGETMQNQIQRMKRGGNKKELKTNEVEDDIAFQKKTDVISLLEKIDEVPEKNAK